MLVAETSKVCFKCGEPKKLSMFYKHPRMADGHVNKCKECNKKDVTENRLDKLNYYRDYDVERNKTDYRKSQSRASVVRRRDTPEFIALRKESSERVKGQYKEDKTFRDKIIQSKNKWTIKNQHKRDAHYVVNNAVRDGKLIKPNSCVKCGKTDCKIYGHHWSYLPEHHLDVLWVCSSCYGKEHRKS